MKVYIQVLVLVLCSCFVQDALSAAPTKPAQQKSVAAPVAKYPNLEKLKTAFWSNFEELNKGNEYSKLVARDTRNLVGTILTDQLFWNLVTDALKKQAKYTHDKRKADTKVRLSNLLTDTLTSPGMADGFLRIADDVYETTVRMNTHVAEDTLQIATEVINSGKVSTFLDSANDFVSSVTLEPDVVHKLFDLSRRYTDMCGMLKLNGGFAKRILETVNATKGKNSGNGNASQNTAKHLQSNGKSASGPNSAGSKQQYKR